MNLNKWKQAHVAIYRNNADWFGVGTKTVRIIDVAMFNKINLNIVTPTNIFGGMGESVGSPEGSWLDE